MGLRSTPRRPQGPEQYDPAKEDEMSDFIYVFDPE